MKTTTGILLLTSFLLATTCQVSAVITNDADDLGSKTTTSRRQPSTSSSSDDSERTWQDCAEVAGKAYKLKNYGKALAYIEKALEKNPPSSYKEMYEKLVLNLTKLKGSTSKEKQVVKREITDEDMVELNTCVKSADKALKLRNYEEAYNRYKVALGKVIALSKLDAEFRFTWQFYTNVGFAALLNGNYEEAYKYYQLGLIKNPSDASWRVRSSAAKAALELKKYEKALEHYKIALTRNPPSESKDEIQNIIANIQEMIEDSSS